MIIYKKTSLALCFIDSRADSAENEQTEPKTSKKPKKT